MTPTVYACVTSRDDKVPRRTREALASAVARAEKDGVRCLTAEVNNPYGVTLCRNAAVAGFLRSKCSHLLFVDDDVTVPPDTITKLLAAGGDDPKVAMGCYPGVKTFADGVTRLYVVVLYLGKGLEDCYTSWPEGVVEVQAGGAGCMLVSREVFEKIPYPWFRWQGTYIPQAGQIVSMGEDIDFCLRVRGAGYKVWADGSVRCGHRKEIDLAQFIQ